MIGITKRVGLACLGLLLSAGTALADPPPSPTEVAVPVESTLEPEPARLALAQQIIAIVLPPDRVDAMVTKLMDALARPMAGQFSAYTQGDPGLEKLFNDFMADAAQSGRTSLIATMPELRTATARAYARNFTEDELSRILAFGQTATGRKYLSRASDLMQDPDVQATFAKMMPQVQGGMQPAVAVFKRKLQAYLKAHPSLAKKMAEQPGK